MGDEDNSTHLRPYILPPLGVPKFSDESGNLNNMNMTTEKQLRQRIGTPAPQKKSPIPDDLDLNNFCGRRGNPVIRVETYKTDEMQRCRNHGLTEKKLKPLSEDIGGRNNNNAVLSRKPQLQPIVSSSLVGKQNGSSDLNGNDIKRHYSRCEVLPVMKSVPPHLGKVHLPNKYPPLKPITKKNVSLDPNNP